MSCKQDTYEAIWKVHLSLLKESSVRFVESFNTALRCGSTIQRHVLQLESTVGTLKLMIFATPVVQNLIKAEKSLLEWTRSQVS
jgi:hypothetical protein